MDFCSHPLTCQNESCPSKHLCQHGTECLLISDEAHALQFLHMCPQGYECPLIGHSGHARNYLHYCKYGSECSLINDSSHTRVVVHSCTHGLYCPHQSDENHIVQFHHPCEKEVECLSNDITTGVHRDLFYHGQLLINNPNDELLNCYGFVRVDKKRLKPLSLDWKRSANTKILFPKDNRTWTFEGHQIDPNDLKNTTGRVFLTHSAVTETINESYVESNINSLENYVQFDQPWDHHGVIVYKNDKVTELMDCLLSQESQHSDGITIRSILQNIVNSNVPVFIVGGAVRDAINEAISKKTSSSVPKAIEKIDIVFGSSSQEVDNAVETPKLKLLKSGGIQIGSDFKPIHIKGRPIKSKHTRTASIEGYGCNLHHEVIHQDFTINCLYYDILNQTIIDTTGKGIIDVIERKLRISEKDPSRWLEWVEMHPSKLIRYWEFLSSGEEYAPVDEKTREFIINQLLDEKYTSSNLQCSRILEVNIKERKNDMESQFKELAFRTAIEQDLGKDWYRRYFDDPIVHASTISDDFTNESASPMLQPSHINTIFYVDGEPCVDNSQGEMKTPQSPSFSSKRVHQPLLSPVSDVCIPLQPIYPSLNSEDPQSLFPHEDCPLPLDPPVSEIPILDHPQLSKKKSALLLQPIKALSPLGVNPIESKKFSIPDMGPDGKISVTLKFRENTVFYEGKVKQVKGRNVVTNLIDVFFLSIHALLFSAVLAFSILEMKGVWSSKFMPLFVKAQFTIYNTIVVSLLSVTLCSEFKMVVSMRFRYTMLDVMKNSYSRYNSFNCFITTLCVVIQFVSVPLTYIYGYEQFYYVRIGLMAGCYVRVFIYSFVSIIMMWIKEGRESSRRQVFLKSSMLFSGIVHFVVSCLVLTTLYLFCQESVNIQARFADSYYDQFYYLRGFVQVLVGWLLNRHFYYLMIFSSVIAFQGLEVMGSSVVFLKSTKIQWLWRIYSWIMMILGSISCSVLCLIIYTMCEFYVPQNIRLHTFLPIFYAIYSGTAHFLWIGPAMICQCKTYRRWSGENKNEHKFSPEELVSALSPTLQEKLLNNHSAENEETEELPQYDQSSLISTIDQRV